MVTGCPNSGWTQVPVHHIFQPVAKTAFAGAFGFPVDGFIEVNHPVFQCSSLYEPGIQRVIQDRFVGPPAMRIIVLVFLDPEGQAFLFQFDADVDIDVGVVGVILVVLDITVAELAQAVDEFPLFVDHDQDTDTVF